MSLMTRARIAELRAVKAELWMTKAELVKATELVCEMYKEASSAAERRAYGEVRYSHNCISLYSDARRWLLSRGIDCYERTNDTIRD